MKDSELIGKVHNAVYQQCKNRGYAAAVDVLVDVGVLTKGKAEEWRLKFHILRYFLIKVRKKRKKYGF